MDEFLTNLERVIKKNSSESACDWIDQAVNLLGSSEDNSHELLRLLSATRRQVCAQRIVSDPIINVDKATEANLSRWDASQATRILLLLTALRSIPDISSSIIDEAYRFGDESEKTAIIKGLFLFPDAGSLKHLALSAGRTNSMVLFSALALDNPYPSRYYTDHEFNQLILKALFNTLDIENVVGLNARANADLSRMCKDYVQERIDAGRPVPTNIWLALTPFADAAGSKYLLSYLDDGDRAHRYFGLLSLSNCENVRPELIDRILSIKKEESDPMMIGLIEDILKN